MKHRCCHSSGSLWLTMFFVAGCGPQDMGGIGIDGTGISTARDIVSQGVVRSLDAFTVNDVAYDTTNATFVIDGGVSSRDAINLGDVVIVEGTVDTASSTAVARRVVGGRILQGHIDAIDVSGRSLVALGQTVRIGSDTLFGPSLAGGLTSAAVGDSISVAGFRNIHGVIIATRVDRQSGSSPVSRTTGAIGGLDSNEHQFSIGGLDVDYGSAVVLLAGGGILANGAFVEVKGTRESNGPFAATSVEIRGKRLNGTDEQIVQIQGYVTALNVGNTGQFEINGLSAATTSATTFNGALTTDAPIAVTGKLSAGGTVVAGIVSSGSPQGGLPTPPAPPAETPAPSAPAVPSAPVVAPTLPSGAPWSPPGPYVAVEGRVFEAATGSVASASALIWVQTSTVSYYIQHNSAADGRFTASVPAGSKLTVVVGKPGFVQPCAVMVDSATSSAFEVEIVARSRLRVSNPPAPLSAAGTTTLTGVVHELVAGGRQPVADAKLILATIDGISFATTISGSDGRYLFCRLPQPSWLDRNWGPLELWVTKEDYKGSYPAVPGDPSQSSEFDVEMEPLF